MRKMYVVFALVIIFLLFGFLLIQKSFAGYSSQDINLSQEQIYTKYKIQTKSLGVNPPFRLIHDQALLLNRGNSLKIGSMIYRGYYFFMEVTQNKKPISFSMSYKYLIEQNIVRIKNIDITITYFFIVNQKGEKLSPWINFRYRIGSDNYFGLITQTAETPTFDAYHYKDKMLKEEKDRIEQMIADLI